MSPVGYLAAGVLDGLEMWAGFKTDLRTHSMTAAEMLRNKSLGEDFEENSIDLYNVSDKNGITPLWWLKAGARQRRSPDVEWKDLRPT